MKKILLTLLLGTALIPIAALSNISKNISEPSVTQELFVKAKNNTNWKLAFLTGKHAQVVFMNVSPDTNPKNEIGMETHPFDQIILIADGRGSVVLNGKTTLIKTGDMIFIPKGTQHNVINSNPKHSMKIVSIYSDTDIPANSVYKKKSDELKK
jgi:quercetin dioxygenase-like cupin family protein